MRASILTIGNELVSGFTTDTNSSWLGQKLVTHRIKVDKVVSVRDSDYSIKAELQSLLNDNLNFIFITGGLGPTLDDITRNSIKEFFNLDESFDQDYYNELTIQFAERGIDIPESNRSQAVVYKNCKMLPNPKGTARGLAINTQNTMVFILPGVPVEMKAIFENSISNYLPVLLSNSIITLKSFGISESSLAEKLDMVLNKWKSQIEIAFLPSHKGVDIRLNNYKNQSINLEEVSETFKKVARGYIFGKDLETLEQVVVIGLIKHNINLSVAESCTGGRLAQYITSVPGSSDVFLGGVIAYSNSVKIDLLGVAKDTIEKYGAVSEEVAIQMSKGIRNKTKSDIGIGITGISGPTGGSKQKPVGLVYIAISGKNMCKARNFILKMDRSMHQEIASYIALNMIRKFYFGK